MDHRRRAAARYAGRARRNSHGRSHHHAGRAFDGRVETGSSGQGAARAGVDDGGADDPPCGRRSADQIQGDARHDSYPVGRSPHHDDAGQPRRLHRAVTRERELRARSEPGDRYVAEAGHAVSDLFLDPDKEIVETRGRAPGSSHEFRDKNPQQWPHLPIVVIVNGGTASAAEIISGALQDHDRALVVGTPTFGKGLVQSFWRLTPETGLKLTTARWYTPSGRTIQRVSKNEEDQVAQVENAAEGKDTVPDSLPVFHTDAGRTVRGGGGIRPDIFAPMDTLTTAERAFAKSLGSNVAVFRDVLTAY